MLMFITEFGMTLVLHTWDWNIHSEPVYAKVEVMHDKRVVVSGEVSPIELKLDPIGGIHLPDNKSTVTQEIKFKSAPSMPNFGFDKEDPDEPEPIKIEFNVTFYPKDCGKNSKIQCPMLDTKLVKGNMLSKRIDLKTGCHDKNQCQCDLRFGQVSRESTKIHVGTKKQLDLEFVVNNLGSEPAYGVTILIATNIDFKYISGPRGNCKPQPIANQSYTVSLLAYIIITFILQA